MKPDLVKRLCKQLGKYTRLMRRKDKQPWKTAVGSRGRPTKSSEGIWTIHQPEAVHCGFDCLRRPFIIKEQETGLRIYVPTTGQEESAKCLAKIICKHLNAEAAEAKGGDDDT